MTRPLRIAVIDSGVNPAHPHIAGVAGGATIGDSVDEGVYLDLIGHGTAVMAAIQEKAPAAEYYAVRVFYNSLRTRIEFLLRAIEWALAREAQLINLSLGTVNPAHAPAFHQVIADAALKGATIISAAEANGIAAIPGSLPGAIGVLADEEIDRDSFRRNPDSNLYHASPYPRSLPNLPRERNLSGVSFAVANMTGLLAAMMIQHPDTALNEMLANSAPSRTP